MIRKLLWKLKISNKKRLSHKQTLFFWITFLLLLNIASLFIFSSFGLNLRIMNNPNKDYTTVSLAQDFINNYTVHYNEYVRDVYDCSEFSIDAVEYAENMGAYCEIIGGFESWDFTKSGHAFLQCQIETQNLSFVNYNAKYPIQIKLS